MANTAVTQILADGPKNAVVNIVGQLDTDDDEVVFTDVVDMSDFTNNDVNATLNGFRIDKILFCNSEGLAMRLFWDATAPQIIAGLAGGHGEFCYEPYNGLQPDVDEAGYTGDIDLTVNNVDVTAGSLPIQTFTIQLCMTKIYI